MDETKLHVIMSYEVVSQKSWAQMTGYIAKRWSKPMSCLQSLQVSGGLFSSLKACFCTYNLVTGEIICHESDPHVMSIWL